MDESSADLIDPRSSDISEEQLDNKQNENQIQGQTPASEKFRFTVEPIVIFLMVAEISSASVITNFLEFQSCTTALNISIANCTNMSPETESKVQVVTADIQMWKSLLEGVLPAFLSFFVGPWSDVNGRKPLFLVATFGFFCYHLSWVILSLLPALPLGYYLLASVPKAFTGGWVFLFVAAYCYIVDITSKETRTFRIGIMEGLLAVGMGIGFFLSPILNKRGFSICFEFSAIVNFLCFLYTVFCLKETIKPEGGIRFNILNWQHPWELMTVLFKKRTNKRRAIVLLLVASFFINIVIFIGELAVCYLWAKLKFHWELSDYTVYQMFSIPVYGLGSAAFLCLFTSKVHFPDLPLAFVISTTRIFSSVILAFAVSSWQVYAASFVSMFSGAVQPLFRATISKILPKHEVGKVFALIASLEAVSPLFASPLYTLIYDSTINMSVSVVYLVSAILYTVITLLCLTTVIIQWRYPAMEYSSLNDGNVEA